MSAFHSICHDLGVPLAEDKTVGPTTCLTFLGLEINTIEMLFRERHPKYVELINHLKQMFTLKRVTLKQLQSVVEKIYIFRRAIWSALAFVRRLYDATIGVIQPHHDLRDTKPMREDILMWCRFLEGFNSVVYFLKEE